MAKLIKAEMFFLDVSDESNIHDVIEIINNDDWLPHAKLISYSEVSFDWDDDVIVNKSSARVRDWEKFFEEKQNELQ